MRTDSSEYPYKTNPLRFQDVALAASLRWAVTEAMALRYLRTNFDDPGEALQHLEQNHYGAPDAFWESL